MLGDDHESDVLTEDGSWRRSDSATENYRSKRVRSLFLGGMLLVLLYIGWRLLAGACECSSNPLSLFAVVAMLLIIPLHSLVVGATVAIGPDDPTEANTTAQADVFGSPDETSARAPMTSRTWLRSSPFQAVLRGDRIEVRSIRRPPVVIPLGRVARITLSTGTGEALTLMDAAGETIAQVGQGAFAGDFLAALAETTGTEIEYLPFSGRPSMSIGS